MQKTLKSPGRRPQTGPQTARGRATSERRSKAMGAPRQHARREVRIGVRLPANHDETAGEVARQDAALDLRGLCGTSQAHIPERGSVGRALCGRNGRLPDAPVTAAAFSGAAVHVLEVLLRTKAKDERSSDEMVLPSWC